MGAWRALGSFIGGHMMFFAPACVVVAVLFPDQIVVLKPLVPFLFALMTFQGSLSNNLSHLAQTVRYPAPMFVTLAVSAVLMPTLACAVGTLLFGSNPNLVCGIVLEYTVPVAVVSSMWIGLFGGDMSLGLATMLVSTVAAPVTMPLTLKVLLGQTVAVDAGRMVAEMLVQIAVPALAGMLVNDLTHGWGKRTLSPAISPAARVGMLMVMLANSTGIAPYVRALTPQLVGVAAFIGVFATSGYVWGLLVARLWKRDRETTVTMTFQCGMRNISAGAVVAAQFFGGETMFPVIIGTLFQQVLAACFGSLMRRVLGEAAEEPDTAGAASDGVIPAGEKGVR